MSYEAFLLANRSSLASLWQLDEASGTAAADSKGSNGGTYTLTPTLNEPALVPNSTGKSVKFVRANNSYVSVASAANLKGQTAFTIEAWVKLASLPASGEIFTIASKVNSFFFTIYNNAGTYKLYGTGNYTDAGPQVTWSGLDTALHHLVMTWDDATNTVSYYVDGTLLGTGTQTSATPAGDSSTFQIGTLNASLAMNGWMDCVAWYTSALSSTEVADNFAQGNLHEVGQASETDTGGVIFADLGRSKIRKVGVGETATGNVRLFGATSGQAYRIYSSASAVLQSAVADANGVVAFTTTGLPATGATIRGFTDNTYTTPLDGQHWAGDIAVGNTFTADPALIPGTGLKVVATDGSYYYSSSQFGSRGQIWQTDDYWFVVYRTGGAGSSFGASDGNVVVVRIDRATGDVDQGPVTLRSGITEGHEVFAIARAPDGKLRFVYGGQNAHLYMRISSSADDVTAWGSAVQLTSSAPASFAGTYIIDSDGDNHIIGGTYSGGDLVYGKSVNATPTSFSWTTVVTANGTLSTGYGVLFGDAVLYESGGTKKLMLCFGSYAKSGGFGSFTAYKNCYYLESTDFFATVKKADGSSAGSVPLAYTTSQDVTGPDLVSSLYHVGGWAKLAQDSGTPVILLDNDRDNLPASNVPGAQFVAHWSGSAWVNHTVPEITMWYENPNTSDPADSRDVANACFGVNIQAKSGTVYLYAAVGYATQPSLDTTYDGFQLLLFRSTDYFANYTVDAIVADNPHGPFTYTDLYDGGAKRGIGIWAAGLSYPKCPPDDAGVVLFSAVDKDFATLLIADQLPQSVSTGLAAETDTGLPATPTVEVPVGVGTETDTGLAVTPASPVSINVGLGTETDTGLEVTPDSSSPPQDVTVGLASETDTALAITVPGSFTMNFAGVTPGTVVGAYLAHEWIGPLTPYRSTGSYPGPVVQEVEVGAYGEATFLLPAGEYVAWMEDFPTRRRFFKVTEEDSA